MEQRPSGLKIGILGLSNLSAGKESIVDQRLGTIKEMAHSAKKAHIEIELIDDISRLMECNGIILTKEKEADIVLMDLEFIERRLSQAGQEAEQKALNRLKQQLENEKFIFQLQLSNEEEQLISGYSLLSLRPIFAVTPDCLEDKSKILTSAYKYFGYISFFTANEKEAHAWPVKDGTSCYQASGLIHSDIQRGFIRAEVIGFNDLINDGGINQARANNHLRLENKEYIVQDADLIKFRFNK